MCLTTFLHWQGTNAFPPACAMGVQTASKYTRTCKFPCWTHLMLLQANRNSLIIILSNTHWRQASIGSRNQEFPRRREIRQEINWDIFVQWQSSAIYTTLGMLIQSALGETTPLLVTTQFVCCLIKLLLLWQYCPTRAMAPSFTRFLDHTKRRSTAGRTPLDE
jgi:hypothetical protein